MRRQFTLLLALLSVIVVLITIQERNALPAFGQESLTTSPTARQMINGRWESIDIIPVDSAEYFRESRAPSATDECSGAPTLLLPDGGQTTTNSMENIDLDDPVLSCMWGTPSSPRGYRSVWYKILPSQTNLVSISTEGSTYDTVLAVYSSDDDPVCSNLIPVACNDDFNFFTSEVTFAARAGQTYYVQVTDWQAGLQGQAVLNLSALPAKLESNWRTVFTLESPRSRHSVVVVDDKLIVIAGQSVTGQFPFRTPSTDQYDTSSGNWNSLSGMTNTGDGLGYSNTTAVKVGGSIFLPSGFIGADGVYDGTQWAYHITGNYWYEPPSNPYWDANDGPAIYSTAVAYSTTNFNGYYLLGGLTGPFPPRSGWQARDEVYSYDINGSWSKVPTAIPTPRFGHVAALQSIGSKSYICVAGGIRSITAAVLSSVECYDPVDGLWSDDIAPLNRARYFAGSAVAPDGNWYVFGGYDKDGTATGTIERYDPVLNRWILLDIRYDLANPARAWSRGGFIGQTLWVVGGEANGSQALSLIEKVEMPEVPNNPLLYFVPQAYNIGPTYSNNTFAGATRLSLNSPINDNFTSAEDNVNVYYFDVPSGRVVSVELSNIPNGSNYNLFAYRTNKALVGQSTEPGNLQEIVYLYANPGRTFVVVERIFPPRGNAPSPNPYQILVK